MDISMITDNPEKLAMYGAAGAILAGYIAKWTANAKTKVGKGLHKLAVTISTKIKK